MTLVILIASLLVFLGLTIKKPSWGLGLLLALVPTYLIRFSISGLPTTYLEVLLAVFLLALLSLNLNKNSWQKLKALGNINWAILAFVAAGIISVSVSPEIYKALGQFKAFVAEPVLLFYAIVIGFNYKEDLRPTLSWLFAGVSLVSVFGIFQYFTHLFLPLRFWGNGEEVKRIVSVFEYPNALALYLAPLFILFVVLLIKNYRIAPKTWLVLGLLAQAAALIMTFSRGAWLAVLVAVFVVLLEKISFKKLALAVLIIGLGLGLLAPVRQRVTVLFSDASGLARMDLLKAGTEKIKQSPVLGNGLYGFRTTLEQQNFQGEILNYPHNIILNFWLELGLLGLLSFAFIMGLALQKYWNKPAPLGLAALGFLLALLVHGLVDVPYFKNDLAILFWFAISILHLK